MADQPRTMTEAVRDLERWRPQAHGCLTCGLVITGLGSAEPPEDCPRCGDLAGGTIHPLVSVSIVRDLLVSLREVQPVIPADLGRELYEALVAIHGWFNDDPVVQDRAAPAIARYEREVGDG